MHTHQGESLHPRRHYISIGTFLLFYQRYPAWQDFHTQWPGIVHDTPRGTLLPRGTYFCYFLIWLCHHTVYTQAMFSFCHMMKNFRGIYRTYPGCWIAGSYGCCMRGPIYRGQLVTHRGLSAVSALAVSMFRGNANTAGLGLCSLLDHTLILDRYFFSDQFQAPELVCNSRPYGRHVPEYQGQYLGFRHGLVLHY